MSPEFLMTLAAKGEHAVKPGGNNTYIGVDPGEPTCYYVVLDQAGLVTAMGTVESFEAIENLVVLYSAKLMILEMEPEVREAKRLAVKHPDKICLFDYRGGNTGFGLATKDMEEGKTEIKLYQMNRTELLDEALAPLRKEEHILPIDSDPEFLSHLSSLYRVQRIVQGKEHYIYMNSGPDHYAHAFAFATLARMVSGRSSKPSAAVGPVIDSQPSVWKIG